MFELNSNFASTNTVTSLAETNSFLTEQVIPKVYQSLLNFASNPTFLEQLKLPFGENFDVQMVQNLASEWLAGNFNAIAPIEIVTFADLAENLGAFAEATNQIYLAQDLLTGDNIEQAVSVVLEEIGHSIDPLFNSIDSIGDDGEIFANVVQGKVLSPQQIQTLKAENDKAVVTIDGQLIGIEKADFDINNRWYVRGYDRSSGSTNYVQWYDFGSNTRTDDGKKGFAGYWGTGTVKDGLPSDKFLLQFWTQADFQQGQTYNFNVKSDDGYALAAYPVSGTSGDDWEFISEWKFNEDAYGGKTLQFTPEKNGEYWVLAYYYDKASDAYFDISWEKKDTVPNGFKEIKTDKGVSLYESDNKNDYVQVVDLSQGASIKLLTGEDDDNKSNGVYGGSSPKFKKENIDDFWNELKVYPNAFSVSNGAFFDSLLFSNVTTLSYPLKANGETYDGFADNNKGKKLKLEIWNDQASITKFDDKIDEIENSYASEVIVGLPEKNADQADENAPRTYVAVKDNDSDKLNETVLILTSKENTPDGASKILTDFGANAGMQLDGSGSTQMIAQDDPLVTSSDTKFSLPDWKNTAVLWQPRSIPQAIGVISGSVTIPPANYA